MPDQTPRKSQKHVAIGPGIIDSSATMQKLGIYPTACETLVRHSARSNAPTTGIES